MVLTTQPLVLSKRMKNDSQANLTEGRTQQVASETSGGSDQCSKGAGGTVREKKKRSDFIDITGLKYGRLTVISYSGTRNEESLWNCVCECGNRSITSRRSLARGLTQSCGCLRLETLSRLRYRHGCATRAGRSSEYTSWSAMKERCLNPKSKYFKNYGARGITVCDEWMKFGVFLSDMGSRPLGTTLERKDNNDSYRKDNCIWATWGEQSNNKRTSRRITFNGKTQTLSQWCDELTLPYNTIIARVSRGWNTDAAFLTPIQHRSTSSASSAMGIDAPDRDARG